MGLGLSHYIPYVVYILVFVISVLAIFYRVELGLFFLVPLSPLQSIWYRLWDFPLGTSLVDIVVIAMLIGWFIQKKESINLRKNSVILVLILVTFAGLFIGSDGFPLSLSNPYLKIWKNFIMMPLLYYITLHNIRDEKNIKILLFLMAFTMLAQDVSFHSSFQYFKSDHYSHKDRISTFEDLGPNEMASFMIQATMVLVGLWLSYKQRLSRYFVGIVIIANSYVILYSYSRAAYMAFLVTLFAFGVLKYRSLLIILVLFLSLWTSVVPVSVTERIQMTEDSSGDLDHAAQVRLDIWKFGLGNFMHNPLGIGFAKFRELGFGEEQNHGRAYDAHNMFVKILTELGAQGLFVFIALYFIGLYSGWSLFKSTSNPFLSGLGLGFIGCVIGNLVCNLFGQDWMLFNVTSYYWVFWALVERAKIIVMENEEFQPLLGLQT